MEHLKKYIKAIEQKTPKSRTVGFAEPIIDSKTVVEIRDKRGRGWFFIDNELVDLAGKHVGANGIAIYTSLSRHANTSQESWPSLELLAAELQLNRHTISKYLCLLEKYFLLYRTTVRKENGKFGHSIYRILNKSQWKLPK